jgi:aldehyde:ferredoxin oxidoreductase
MTAFQEQAKANGLSQEAAQGMLDLYGKTVQTQVEAAAKHLAEQQTQTWTEVNKAWLAELEAVPDFQGDTKKTSLAIMAKALEEYGVGDVRQAFALTGAGNNPAIVQTFLKMAKALSEGTPVSSGAPISGPRTTGAVLYGEPST